MRRATLTFSCLLLASTAYAVKLTVITAKGYVQFVAGDDWRVIESQTKPPVAVIAFEIADPADEGTDDATNLAVNLYDATTDEGRDAMKLIGRKYGDKEPAVSRFGEWKIFEQRAMQNGTRYTIMDATRPIADVVASVRLAWPHLPAQTRSHEKRMHELFKATLKSFSGSIGVYKPRKGEVTHRPKPRD